jgi:zinc protease
LLPSTTKNVRRHVLSNGLTVLIKENRAAPVAAVLAHVNVGYFNEPDRWNGLSHVIEHMFFKGTRKRPGKEQIAEDVRAMGGSINASTSYDTTAYHITVPSANVERAVEIQADTFLNSLFDGEELAKEIEVIIQESKQKRDNPGAMLLETMYAHAYDRHRIRRWRIGSDDILRSFRREDILAFIEQTYRPENIVLSVVGDVDTNGVLQAVEREWLEMPRILW